MPPTRRDALLGIAVGSLGVVAVVAACVPIRDDVPHTVPMLLLLVPVVGASALAGWRVSLPVAVFGALAFALLFLPPINSPRVAVSEDLLVLVVFVVVALVVGLVSGARRAAPAAAVTGRAHLLRGVSHDLRTPLSTISSISAELRADSDRFDPATRARLLDRVVDESDRLQRIVGNLLSATRLEAGALRPDLEPCAIEPILRRSATRIAIQSGRPVDVDLDGALGHVDADPVQIDQVLTNLIENAVRHTPRPAKVVVSARSTREGCAVSIDDDGPGFRLPLPTTVGADGHGLGLVVSRAILVAHGTTLVIRDADELGGASVAFTLPWSDRHAGGHR